MAKTTGTAARLLLPDGTEMPLLRRGRANIREQLWLLRRAHALGVQAVVTECMAIHPALQWTAEKEIMQSTLGVITNVRTDHTEVMGKTLKEIALSLANSIPRQGTLVLGETTFAPLFREAAERLQTRVVEVPSVAQDWPSPTPSSLAPGCPASSSLPKWMIQCTAIVLEVAKQLGLSEQMALMGIRAALPDPGAAHCGMFSLGGRSIRFLDATAANDPESLHQLLEDYRANNDSPLQILFHTPLGRNHYSPDDSSTESSLATSREWLLVYNHRVDRPERLRSFLHSDVFHEIAAGLVVTGDCPCWTLWREVKQAKFRSRPCYLPMNRLLRHIEQLSSFPAGVLFCGNTRGLNLRTLSRSGSRG